MPHYTTERRPSLALTTAVLLTALCSAAQSAPAWRYQVVEVDSGIVAATVPGQGAVGRSDAGRAARAWRWHEGSATAVELPSGGHSARASYLAAGGAVAGTLRSETGSHAVRWNGSGQLDAGPAPGDRTSTPTGLAADGTLTGHWFDADGTARTGFVVDAGGTRHPFPLWQQGDISMPLAISPSGWIAATANATVDGVRRCVRAVGGAIEPLPMPPGAGWCSPVAIADTGHVVATVGQADGGAWRAVQWNGIAWTDLGDLGGAWVRAVGMNASGTIVGMSRKRTKKEAAFLWSGGRMYAVDSLLIDRGAGAHVTSVSGIDDEGRIAATLRPAGERQDISVILSPVRR